MCPEQDSNLHDLKVTSPSSWRVYQFHHLGIWVGKYTAFCNNPNAKIDKYYWSRLNKNPKKIDKFQIVKNHKSQASIQFEILIFRTLEFVCNLLLVICYFL